MEHAETVIQEIQSVQLLEDWSMDSTGLLTSRQNRSMIQQVSLQPSHQHAALCFASELEQDIAALEAQANRDAGWDWCGGDATLGSSDTGLYHTVSNDLCSYDQHHQDSDMDSESESEDPEEALAARVSANAAMVQRCGKPLQQGAWKGCCKSAWCDREDRHRGLCNHRATIPGPAACQQHSEDACSSEQQDEAHLDATTHMRRQAPAELSSGGHSHNCKSSMDNTDGDEREVASALKPGTPGSTEDSSQLPFSSLPDQQQQQQHQASSSFPDGTGAAAEHPCTPLGQQLPPVELEFWGCCGSSDGAGAAAAAAAAAAVPAVGDLLVMPGVYQPLVKDLSGSGISSMLSADDEVLCCVDKDLDPAMQPLKMQFDDLDGSMDCSCQTIGKPDFSTPSSPSCASVEASRQQQQQQQFQQTAFFSQPVSSADAAAAAAAAASTAGLLSVTQLPQPAAAAAGAGAASCAVSNAFRLAGLLPLVEVHPCLVVAAPPAAAAAASLPAADHTADADEQPMSSTSSGSEQLAELDAPCTAADAATHGSGSAAAGAGSGHPTSARVRAIKNKQAERAARVLLEQQSSPNKGKKRPAGRMAPNPSSGHSCTQCGAVSTPVWRAGPAGPKTLCNACGVRYMKNARRK